MTVYEALKDMNPLQMSDFLCLMFDCSGCVFERFKQDPYPCVYSWLNMDLDEMIRIREDMKHEASCKHPEDLED